jgi:hypothetical protein
MRVRFVVFVLLLIAAFSLPRTVAAEACKYCKKWDGIFYCIGTDCDAYDKCHITPDKEFCMLKVQELCDGPADKWFCEQYDWANTTTDDHELSDDKQDEQDKRLIDRSIEDSNGDGF